MAKDEDKKALRDRDGPLPLVMNREAAEPYYWGDAPHRSQAWRLLDGADLTVTEEVMPPGAAEQRHSHTFARQYFYVLEGEAVMAVAERTYTLKQGDGIHVSPKQAHQIRNESDAEVRFLVIASPRATGDRTPR